MRMGLALFAGIVCGFSRAATAGAPAAPSLYERLGGAYAIAGVVDEFVERLVVDAVLEDNPWVKEAFQKVNKAGLKFRITSLVCQATGGPEKYAGRSMKESHKHLYAREEDWAAVASDLKAALDRYSVPQKEQDELMAIVGTLKKDIVLKGPLDGRNFAGMCGKKGGADESGQFGFLASHARSGYFADKGFQSGLYSSAPSGKGLSFEAVQVSESQGSISWKGTIEGGTMEATGTWKRAGQPDEEWTFRGNEAKEEKKD